VKEKQPSSSFAPSRLCGFALKISAFGLLVICSACNKNDQRERDRDTPSEFKEDRAGKQPCGAELWARNCRRCHNIPSPNSYSADQWEVIVNHMRIRASLTAKDAHKIEEFLKAAN